jgi:hypothetical protein
VGRVIRIRLEGDMSGFVTQNDPEFQRDWSGIWEQALLRDRLKCVYCGLDGSLSLNAFRQLTISLDHLLPKKDYGGDDSLNNLVTCCWACNRKKSNRDPRVNAHGSLDANASRERMIENVKEFLKGDWDYNERARTILISRMSNCS